MAKNKQNFYNLSSQLNLPFLETKKDFLKNIFEELELKFELKKDSNLRFIDLGCGDGRVIFYAALNYGIKSIGLEINTTLINEAKYKLKLLKSRSFCKKRLLRKIKIKYGDIFQQNLRDYNFIYIFSLPTMHSYLKHVFNSAQKDSIIISYMYPFTKFNNCLILEDKLDLKADDQKVSAFFYRKA